MQKEKNGVNFHIQFSRTDPAHLHVAGIIKSQARGYKAKYIVNAVLYYESHCGSSDIKHMTLIDEKHLEAAINRILQNRDSNIRDKEKSSADVLPVPPLSPVSPLLNKVHKQPPVKDIKHDELDVIGADEVNAIASTMKMFKTKR